MDNIQFVNELYDAFKRSDLPYILERFGKAFKYRQDKA